MAAKTAKTAKSVKKTGATKKSRHRSRSPPPHPARPLLKRRTRPDQRQTRCSVGAGCRGRVPDPRAVRRAFRRGAQPEPTSAAAPEKPARGERYDPKQIESKWQARWEADQLYRATVTPAARNSIS